MKMMTDVYMMRWKLRDVTTVSTQKVVTVNVSVHKGIINAVPTPHQKSSAVHQQIW
jgi:hypothetical protein